MIMASQRIEILKPDKNNPHPKSLSLAGSYACGIAIPFKIRRGGRTEHHTFRVIGIQKDHTDEKNHVLTLMAANAKARKFVGAEILKDVKYNEKTGTGECEVPEKGVRS